MDKTSFELKSGYNSFETAGADGKLIRLEEGVVYTTADPNEIAALSQQPAVKQADTPEGARAGTRTAADEPKKAGK